MDRKIEIAQEVYDRLASQAKGFETPNEVIRRLLDDIEGRGSEQAKSELHETVSGRDFTKYTYNGRKYGKGRLVLAVVSEYVRVNDGLSYEDLNEAFPKHLQGSHGVFRDLDGALEIYKKEGRKRFFIDTEDSIQLSDGSIAVCTQWGTRNINKFIDAARNLGLEISAS